MTDTVGMNVESFESDSAHVSDSAEDVWKIVGRAVATAKPGILPVPVID